MKMTIIIIIIIIARFSKIQIHWKSIKKVKERISLERRRLARFEVLIAHFLCVKIIISFVFFNFRMIFWQLSVYETTTGYLNISYNQVRNKILVLMSLPPWFTTSCAIITAGNMIKELITINVVMSAIVQACKNKIILNNIHWHIKMNFVGEGGVWS